MSVWGQLLASLGERFVVMRSSIRMRTLAADNLASGSSSQHSWIVSTTVHSPWEVGGEKEEVEVKEEEKEGEEKKRVEEVKEEEEVEGGR